MKLIYIVFASIIAIVVATIKYGSDHCNKNAGCKENDDANDSPDDNVDSPDDNGDSPSDDGYPSDNDDSPSDDGYPSDNDEDDDNIRDLVMVKSRDMNIALHNSCYAIIISDLITFGAFLCAVKDQITTQLILTICYPFLSGAAYLDGDSKWVISLHIDFVRSIKNEFSTGNSDPLFQFLSVLFQNMIAQNIWSIVIDLLEDVLFVFINKTFYSYTPSVMGLNRILLLIANAMNETFTEHEPLELEVAHHDLSIIMMIKRTLNALWYYSHTQMVKNDYDSDFSYCPKYNEAEIDLNIEQQNQLAAKNMEKKQQLALEKQRQIDLEKQRKLEKEIQRKIDHEELRKREDKKFLADICIQYEEIKKRPNKMLSSNSSTALARMRLLKY